MKELKMPERSEFDGPCGVRRIGEVIIVESTQGAMTTHVEMSEYNAWRVFGCLALLLEIPLPARIGKAIKLGGPRGEPPKAIIGYPPPSTLGERVAQNLAMKELERTGFVVRDERDGPVLDAARALGKEAP